MRSLLPFRTLRGHLTLLACVATLPAFFFVVYIAMAERNAAVRKAETDARYAANLASREHAHQIAGARRLLERLVQMDSSQQIRDTLPAILSGFPQVANLGLLDRRGNVTYSVVALSRTVEMRDEPAFVRALTSRDVEVGQYRVGKIVERPVLILARALRAGSGGGDAVLFAALELSWLDELAREADVPSETALAIVDRSGTVLAASNSERRPAVPHRLERFEELRQRGHGMVRIAGLDGVARLCVAVPLRGVSGLWVVVGSPEERIQSLANRVFYRDLAVLALFALFAIAMSVIAADLSVLHDLRLLARATRRFGAGEWSARSPVPLAQGEIRDVTTAFNSMASALEQRDAEATAARETLRALTHRSQTIRDEEARRIARELHDELGQDLTVMKIDLATIRRRVGEESSALAAIDALDETIDRALQSVRRISSELRPGVLDRLGVTSAIEWLLREAERRGSLRTELQADELDDDIAPDAATALFRITQEALTNIARHAEASAASVTLRAEGDQVTLRIRDDGRGFDPTTVRRTSLGLLGMQERAQRLGGSLRVVSSPGHGTEVIASIPRAPAQPLNQREESWSAF